MHPAHLTQIFLIYKEEHNDEEKDKISAQDNHYTESVEVQRNIRNQLIHIFNISVSEVWHILLQNLIGNSGIFLVPGALRCTISSQRSDSGLTPLYLFGCPDDYAAMIIRRKAELTEYIAPGPAADLYGSIQKKAEFYEVCEKFGIPYPDSKILTAPVDAAELTEDKLGFAYPIIVKPSSSVDYWKHPFDTMKKVYTAATPAEAAEIVKTIYASGYPDRMVLQKMVPGGDDHMRVLTAFSDENGKVRAMCLGHTMVEEHTPHGLGNHAAIVSEDTTSLPLVENIRKMLEACRYTGFSNFDIKYSGTPGDYRVFEINLRQGRSNYYVTATGMNIARLVVEKWNDGGTDCVLNKNEVFWHHVPAQVAFTYTEDKDLVARAKALKAQGKEACSLLYKPDLLWNPVRYACVLEQLRRQFKKFKTYYPVHK